MASRGGPRISHLFFADNLILFAEASKSQIDVLVIMECFNDFCAISGQVISPAKEKLFVSPNFHKLTAREISARCQIPLTADLGKYLGLIHKRVSKTTYYHILEKVQDRLAGWKAEQLSMAGRTLLVQSSAIPVYTMQTTRIPEAINQEIDRRNCRFVWVGEQG